MTDKLREMAEQQALLEYPGNEAGRLRVVRSIIAVAAANAEEWRQNFLNAQAAVSAERNEADFFRAENARLAAEAERYRAERDAQLGASGEATSLSKERDELRRQLEEARKQLNFDTRLAGMHAEIARVEKQLNERDAEIERLNDMVTNDMREFASLNAELRQWQTMKPEREIVHWRNEAVRIGILDQQKVNVMRDVATELRSLNYPNTLTVLLAERLERSAKSGTTTTSVHRDKYAANGTEAKTEPAVCGAKEFGGYTCTLAPNHGGKHEAKTLGGSIIFGDHHRTEFRGDRMPIGNPQPVAAPAKTEPSIAWKRCSCGRDTPAPSGQCNACKPQPVAAPSPAPSDAVCAFPDCTCSADHYCDSPNAPPRRKADPEHPDNALVDGMLAKARTKKWTPITLTDVEMAQAKVIAAEIFAESEAEWDEHTELRTKLAANTALGCHNWTGAISDKGYGVVRVDGRNVGAHRAVWRMHHGAIPEGMFVCHTCDNRKCVNQAHLFLGTHADNMKDMAKKRRAHGGPHSIRSRKLTREEIEAIKASLAAGEKHEVIAQRFDVSRSHVTSIANGYRQNEVRNER